MMEESRPLVTSEARALEENKHLRISYSLLTGLLMEAQKDLRDEMQSLHMELSQHMPAAGV